MARTPSLEDIRAAADWSEPLNADRLERDERALAEALDTYDPGEDVDDGSLAQAAEDAPWAEYEDDQSFAAWATMVAADARFTVAYEAAAAANKVAIEAAEAHFAATVDAIRDAIREMPELVELEEETAGTGSVYMRVALAEDEDGAPIYDTDSALRISDHPGRTSRGGAKFVSQKTGEAVFFVYIGDDPRTQTPK